jgi:hypothetical protein
MRNGGKTSYRAFCLNYLRVSLAIPMLIIAAIPADACPVIAHAGEAKWESLKHIPRNRLRAQILNAADKSKARMWQAIPLQVDPSDDKGVLLFPQGAELTKAMSSPIQKHDRISLRAEDFGSKWNHKDPWPCAAKEIVEVRSREATNRFAYLMSCEDALDVTVPTPITHRTAHDLAGHRVLGPLFTYNYVPDNQLVFTTIDLHPNAPAQKFPIATNADLTMRGDIKGFFNVLFDSSDVTSELHNVRPGPLGMMGQLSFFLSLLFFKIDMQAETTVTFYRDAVHLPLAMTFPIDISQRVNPSTGILFTWQDNPKELTWNIDDSMIPRLNAEKVKAGPQALANAGLSYCQFGDCVYRIRGRMRDHDFAMTFHVPQEKVEKGFYPMFVEDAAASFSAMGWGQAFQKDPHRVGTYLEVSGLSQGVHMYDLWMQISEPGQSISETCPKKIAGSIALVPPKIKGGDHGISH